MQGSPNKVVLIVAHENITNSFYEGQHRSYLISNLLFREGGAAALMSNRYCLFAQLVFKAISSKQGSFLAVVVGVILHQAVILCNCKDPYHCPPHKYRLSQIPTGRHKKTCHPHLNGRIM